MKNKLTFDEIAAENKKIQIGRPLKEKGIKLDKKISCYFTEAEMQQIDIKRGGTPKATFVRNLVLNAISKE